MSLKSTPDPKLSLSINPVSLVLTLCAISALLIYLVYSQNIVFGSKAGNWVYPYFDPITPISRWLYLIVIGLLGIIILIGGKLIDSFEKTTLLVCFVLACLIEVWIHSAYPTPLWILVDSDISNSFYTVANQFSPLEILHHYNQTVVSFPGHAGTNMPGKIMIFQLLNLVTSSRQTIGYLVIAVSTLGAPLIYGICKRLFQDRRPAFYAFLLYVLIPGKLFFFPILNTVTPVFILLCLLLFMVYLDGKRTWALLLLGAAIYLLVFFEPSPLITGIIFIGLLLNAIRDKKVAGKDLLKILVIPSIAFMVVYLLMRIIFSFDLIRTTQYVLLDAAKFNRVANRDYWIWVKENVKEFIYSGGIPVMLLFTFMIAHVLSQWRSFRFSLSRWTLENIYLLSLLATFLIVWFSGINRGEITRLWIYLAVFFQIPAAWFLSGTPQSRVLFFIVASLLAVQSIVTIQRVAFIMH